MAPATGEKPTTHNKRVRPPIEENVDAIFGRDFADQESSIEADARSEDSLGDPSGAQQTGPWHQTDHSTSSEEDLEKTEDGVEEQEDREEYEEEEEEEEDDEDDEADLEVQRMRALFAWKASQRTEKETEQHTEQALPSEGEDNDTDLDKPRTGVYCHGCDSERPYSWFQKIGRTDASEKCLGCRTLASIKHTKPESLEQAEQRTAKWLKEFPLKDSPTTIEFDLPGSAQFHQQVLLKKKDLDQVVAFVLAGLPTYFENIAKREERKKAKETMATSTSEPTQAESGRVGEPAPKSTPGKGNKHNAGKRSAEEESASRPSKTPRIESDKSFEGSEILASSKPDKSLKGGVIHPIRDSDVTTETHHTDSIAAQGTTKDRSERTAPVQLPPPKPAHLQATPQPKGFGKETAKPPARTPEKLGTEDQRRASSRPVTPASSAKHPRTLDGAQEDELQPSRQGASASTAGQLDDLSQSQQSTEALDVLSKLADSFDSLVTTLSQLQQGGPQMTVYVEITKEPWSKACNIMKMASILSQLNKKQWQIEVPAVSGKAAQDLGAAAQLLRSVKNAKAAEKLVTFGKLKDVEEKVALTAQLFEQVRQAHEDSESD